MGEGARSLQEKSVSVFESRADRRSAEYHAQAIERLAAQYNSFKNDPRKNANMNLNQLYQQTLAHHYAEVKILRAQIDSVDKGTTRAAMSHGLETLEESKGHLKLFQSLALDLTRVQSDSLVPDGEKLAKVQMSIAHMQQAATRFSFDRMDHGIELLRNALKGSVLHCAPAAVLAGSVKDTPLENKYFQQLEKIRTENEILQSKMGVLEATMQEAELSRPRESPAKFGLAKPDGRCIGMLKSLMLKSKGKAGNATLLTKIQELNKKVIQLTDEITKQQKENGVLRRRLLSPLP